MSISQAVAQHLPYLSRYARALAGKELAAEIATDVLIIEDETFIALDLEGLVKSLDHRVLGVARTHTEAVNLAKAKRPWGHPRRYPTGRRQFGP